VAVLGDQYLVPVMGASAADVWWPPTAALVDGVEPDAHGYAVDAAVVAAARPVLDAFDLAVLHVNGPDTAGHVLGPDSPEALDAYRASDAVLGHLVDALQPAWDDTVVIVVSDHDMETVGDAVPVDLWAEAADRGLDVLPIPEGNGTVVWGTAEPAWLDNVDGVAGWEQVTARATVAWADPGRWFALPPGMEGVAERGQHGGGTTRDQVAVVSGGHPAAADLAARVAAGPVDATEWAPAIAALLGASLRP
jgi:hypothetical protein